LAHSITEDGSTEWFWPNEVPRPIRRIFAINECELHVVAVAVNGTALRAPLALIDVIPAK
jgi:hypothetical protein